MPGHRPGPAHETAFALFRSALAPLVPFVEFRHRSWLEEDERADARSFLQRHGLSYVSVDAPRTRAAAVLRRLLDEAGVPATGAVEPASEAPTLL